MARDLPITGGTYSAEDIPDQKELDQYRQERDQYRKEVLEAMTIQPKEGEVVTTGVRDTSGFELNLPWVVDTPTGKKYFRTEGEAIEYTNSYIEGLVALGQDLVPIIFGTFTGLSIYYAVSHPNEAQMTFKAVRDLAEPIINGLTGALRGIGEIIPG